MRAAQLSGSNGLLAGKRSCMPSRSSSLDARRKHLARSTRPAATPAQQPALYVETARAGSRLQDTAAAEIIASAPPVHKSDFLVLGSGIAGLTYALKVAEYGTVSIVTKDCAQEGSTHYAQGGVCAVLDPLDSVQKHVRDTIVAGAFLNNPDAVDAVCREGPAAVLELAAMGAAFTRNPDGSLHLTQEGGHSGRRIVHAADVTGREIERALLAAADANPNVRMFEHHLATDLVVDEVAGMAHCLGADVLDQRANTMMRFVAPVTLLATGGMGQAYPNTTNPSVCTGDGIAMAHRAAADVSNLEFVQFHPTGFHLPDKPLGSSTFLISEAVRGEGGRLFNQAGERFMPDYDARLELAPRDVVARSIYDQMLKHDQPHVLLDISHKPAAQILEHFPNIAARCRQSGIDITRDPIPVAPAQHYMCGGVQTGLLGETRIPGLYACGEVACTGLHGANRLASNSLLEGLVFANRAVQPSVSHLEYATKYAAGALRHAAAPGPFTGSRAPCQLTRGAADWVGSKRQELTGLMWESAGILRRQADMKRALQRLATLRLECQALREVYGTSAALVELRNLVTVGELVVRSALMRKESRGLHHCLDFPEVLEHADPSVIGAKAAPQHFGLARRSASTSQHLPSNRRHHLRSGSQARKLQPSPKRVPELSPLRSQSIDS